MTFNLYTLSGELDFDLEELWQDVMNGMSDEEYKMALDHMVGQKKKPRVCECGALKVGAPGHSNWCPLY